MSVKRQKLSENVEKISNAKKSEVMNDDVLIRVLNCLKVKQLLQLERVSKQFSDCVGQVLKRQNGLRIGSKLNNHLCHNRNDSIVGGNISDAIVVKDNQFYDLVESKTCLLPILSKCSNIKSFYLNNCRIDYETIELIVTNCSQLQCLSLVHICCPLDNKFWLKTGKMLAEKGLIHLSINCQCLPLRKQFTRNRDNFYRCAQKQYLSTEIDVLVKRLSSLESLILCDYRKPLVKLFNSLPKTVRSLYLSECHKLNDQSICALVNSNAKHLEELKVDVYIYERDYESQIFDTICAYLKLKKLYYYCGELPTTSISNISKLVDLQELKIDFAYNSFINFKNVEPNQLKSLRKLHLENCGFKPRMLVKFSKQFPNIKELTLKSVNFICQCNQLEQEDNNNDYHFYDYDFCHECYQKCVNFLSQLPLLKVLHIHFDCNDIRLSLIHALVQFKELVLLDIPWFPNDRQLLKELSNACNKIVDNRVHNKLLTLIIDEDIIKQLTDNCLEVTITKNLRLIKC